MWCDERELTQRVTTIYFSQSTIQAQIQRELLINHGISTNDRRAALEVARSLQSQLFFYEVEWGGRALTDGVEDVYMFLDDQEGGSDARIEMEELPTGVVTYLTKCYTPCCVDGHPCYAYSCPRRVSTITNSGDSRVHSKISTAVSGSIGIHLVDGCRRSAGPESGTCL